MQTALPEPEADPSSAGASMSFIMISAGSSSSPIRMMSVRALFVCSCFLALLVLAAGFGLGRWLSMITPGTTVTTAATAATAAATAALAVNAGIDKSNSTLTFAVEQLGALSGRLFKLESQAGQLSQRFGVNPGSHATLPAPTANRAPMEPGSGGPLLAARPALDSLGGLDALEARLNDVEQQISLVADAASLQGLAQMAMPTRIPVAGAWLASGFGNREDPFTGRHAFHAGLDFAVAQGTVIHAAGGGKVIYAGFKPDFGWVVDIEHGNGLTTRYAHASKLLVHAGALVMPGDPIAAVGSTGRSTGPHLHFEVLRGGEATDPRHYLAGL
jgi:murein DD-endopeptidase MepM/ murein hydrolase activator NlpD